MCDVQMTLLSLRLMQMRGIHCTKHPLKCTFSPDGRYILSGSEDGKLYLWDVETSAMFTLDQICTGKQAIHSVTWNNRHHMFALGPFGTLTPILICIAKDQGIILPAQKTSSAVAAPRIPQFSTMPSAMQEPPKIPEKLTPRRVGEMLARLRAGQKDKEVKAGETGQQKSFSSSTEHKITTYVKADSENDRKGTHQPEGIEHEEGIRKEGEVSVKEGANGETGRRKDTFTKGIPDDQAAKEGTMKQASKLKRQGEHESSSGDRSKSSTQNMRKGDSTTSRRRTVTKASNSEHKGREEGSRSRTRRKSRGRSRSRSAGRSRSKAKDPTKKARQWDSASSPEVASTGVKDNRSTKKTDTSKGTSRLTKDSFTEVPSEKDGSVAKEHKKVGKKAQRKKIVENGASSRREDIHKADHSDLIQNPVDTAAKVSPRTLVQRETTSKTVMVRKRPYENDGKHKPEVKKSEEQDHDKRKDRLVDVDKRDELTKADTTGTMNKKQEEQVVMETPVPAAKSFSAKSSETKPTSSTDAEHETKTGKKKVKDVGSSEDYEQGEEVLAGEKSIHFVTHSKMKKPQSIGTGFTPRQGVSSGRPPEETSDIKQGMNVSGRAGEEGGLIVASLESTRLQTPQPQSRRPQLAPVVPNWTSSTIKPHEREALLFRTRKVGTELGSLQEDRTSKDIRWFPEAATFVVTPEGPEPRETLNDTLTVEEVWQEAPAGTMENPFAN
ncbi:hypothetical protein CBR_g21831 [Chara braunii]|uniref:Uncharacterized protein n=1 Tax=Chara braunii TaxID=69332 RepID=A0A388JUK9_CHABU|nr:hypothetical protein CBR_g21831 [Chara braunii]|eukprot:GBG61488.1 hypothetical protein CBR_g21831 [Chara braunii]